MPKLYEEETTVKQNEQKDVALWHERISISKKSSEAWADESGAKRFIREYKGDFGIVFKQRNRSIPVPPINEVFAYVQSDIATTYSRDPYITVNAEAGTVRGAAIWEIIINYYWRKLNIKEELEHEIIDKDLVGYGLHKTGYNPGVGTIFSSSVSWKDLVWNIGSKRPPVDCQWMGHRIVLPLDDIKKKYPSAKGMEGSPNPDIDDETYKKSSYKDDIRVGVLWEIWDVRKREKFLLAENLKDRYLEKPSPWPEYQTRFPFRMYWDFAVPGSSRPMSAIAPWEAQILEEMVLMGSAMGHVKRWNRQMFYENGAIDDNAMDKYELGYDGAAIPVNGKLSEGIIKFADYGPLPTDFYLLMDRLQAIKRNVNGQPEFVRGGVTKTASRTIGELNKMEAGAKGRQERKMDRLETHLENIARDMIAHLKGNFDFEETIKITGDTPEELVEALGENFNPETGIVTFTPEDIEGEYDVEVKAGSTLPLNKENRMEVMEIVLQTVAQVAAQGPVSNLMSALIQEMLKDYDIKSLKEAYAMDLQEVEQSKAQAQQQQGVQDQKTAAEAEKRLAQSQQIQTETAITTQEAELGPLMRAELEKLKKPEQKVSESISFKDLPPDGKMQMAAQAGIQINRPPPTPVPGNGTSK